MCDGNENEMKIGNGKSKSKEGDGVGNCAGFWQQENIIIITW